MRALNKPVKYLPPYKRPFHLIGFSKKGIEIMAQQTGFKVGRIIRRHDYWASTYIKKSIFYWPVAVVLYMADLIGLGNNQEIVLVKK